MKKISTLLLLVSALAICAHSQTNKEIQSTIDGIFSSIRNSEKFNAEAFLSVSGNYFELKKAIIPYYSDSLTAIRKMAYTFIAKSGLQSTETKVKNDAIEILLESCLDIDSYIVFSAIGYLQEFNKEDFTKQTEEIALKTLKGIKFQKSTFIRLLPFYQSENIGLALDSIITYSNNKHEKWAASLALAKLGNKEAISRCYEKIVTIQASNEFMYSIAPDIIYTRQKNLIDLLVSMLSDRDLKCTSANPDKESKLHCGYYVIELLAPIIDDFPIIANENGEFEIILRNETLELVKTWFLQHPNYTLKNKS